MVWRSENPVSKLLLKRIGEVNVTLGYTFPQVDLTDFGSILNRERMIGEMKGLSRIVEEFDAILRELQDHLPKR